ncbi:MAG: lytic transglycosylase domain-containing protein [Hyphomicrobiales bacterium]
MKVTTSPSVSERIETAFKTAAKSTGTGFDFLLRTAVRESNLDATAKAKTSSATGMFQFIESTWLEMVKEEGPKYGLSEQAAAITRSADGRYRVSDAGARREILDLRNDPKVSAVMAGAYASRNAETLEARLGRDVSSGELYIAHFLGPSGGSKLISLAENNPDASAAAAFPKQAKANRSIFYEANGQPRSVSEVYDKLVRGHDNAAPAAPTMVAEAPQTPSEAVAAAAGDEVDGLAPRMANAFAGFEARDPAAVFDAFFRTDSKAEQPVSVEAFWAGFGEKAEAAAQSGQGTVRTAAAGAIAADVPTPTARPGAIGVWEQHMSGEPLDLQQYLREPLRDTDNGSPSA